MLLKWKPVDPLLPGTSAVQGALYLVKGRIQGWIAASCPVRKLELCPVGSEPVVLSIVPYPGETPGPGGEEVPAGALALSGRCPDPQGFSGFLAATLDNDAVFASQPVVFPSADAWCCLPDVPMARSIGHGDWLHFLARLCNRPGKEILEVGSRVVTGANHRAAFDKARYTGFDYHPGDNVDVVGDAHRLSTYFSKRFDLIFSSAVFERLAMHWIASLEMIRLLSPAAIFSLTPRNDACLS